MFVEISKEIKPFENIVYINKLSNKVFTFGINNKNEGTTHIKATISNSSNSVVITFNDFNCRGIENLGISIEFDLFNKIHGITFDSVEITLANHRRINNFFVIEIGRLKQKLKDGGSLDDNVNEWMSRVLFFIQYSFVSNPV